MIFLGVALPQMSAAGIAFAFLGYRICVGQHQHFVPNERLLAMLDSLSWTLVGLLMLAALARHRETVEARIGTAYAIAAAATILFLPLSDEVAAARRAGTALYHYALAAAQHDDLTAARLQTEVRASGTRRDSRCRVGRPWSRPGHSPPGAARTTCRAGASASTP
jgi:hypothetical protein